jgi:hypothetical protein
MIWRQAPNGNLRVRPCRRGRRPRSGRKRLFSAYVSKSAVSDRAYKAIVSVGLKTGHILFSVKQNNQLKRQRLLKKVSAQLLRLHHSTVRM